MWNLKYDTDEPIYERERDHREQIRGSRRRVGGDRQEFGTSRCKLLYIKWMNNKVLLYSTGNYTQYPIISLHGKEYEKQYIHTHIYSKITVQRKLAQHCKLTILN